MTARQEVLALAEAQGFKVDTGGGRHFEVLVECRPGFRFDDDVHERVFAAWDAEPAALVWCRALVELRELVHTGRVTRCLDDECDWCHEVAE